MLKYRFDVGDALERIGFNMYKAKTTGILSQDTLKKIKNEDTNINAKSINNLCHYIVNGKRIIGKTNIERLFVFLTKYKNEKLPIIKDLF